MVAFTIIFGSCGKDEPVTEGNADTRGASANTTKYKLIRYYLQYDIKMALRQAGSIHRPIVSLACIADNSDTGKN